jgi:putative hydrolase of the HAD superfamily
MCKREEMGEELSFEMKYTAIIFDLFGTLIDKLSLREHKAILRQMASIISVPPDDFVRLWFATFNMRGLGVFKNLGANIEYICRELGAQPGKSEVALASQINLRYTASAMKPRREALELLSHLKSQGYKTGLISDCSAEIPELFQNLPLAPLIDVTVFSSLVGIVKPDPRIYQLAAKRLLVEPGECLYVGDGDSNELTGAARAGMNPVLISNPHEDRTDVHRVDAEAEKWQGSKILSLGDILTLLK